MARVIWPLIFGLVGCAMLVSLGIWQVQRLAVKEALLADISARIAAAPVKLPEMPDAERDRYLPVALDGRIVGGPLRVLVSQRGQGAGYRLIWALESDGRILMLDQGILPAEEPTPPAPENSVSVVGNLHWPEEVDSFTPDPDRQRNQWFARDLPVLAAELGAEPVLIVAREVTGMDARVVPLPVDTSNIPNDHLSYAITWFSLAVVWLGMTAFLLWRITRRRI